MNVPLCVTEPKEAVTACPLKTSLFLHTKLYAAYYTYIHSSFKIKKGKEFLKTFNFIYVHLFRDWYPTVPFSFN